MKTCTIVFLLLLLVAIVSCVADDSQHGRYLRKNDDKKKDDKDKDKKDDKDKDKKDDKDEDKKDEKKKDKKNKKEKDEEETAEEYPEGTEEGTEESPGETQEGTTEETTEEETVSREDPVEETTPLVCTNTLPCKSLSLVDPEDVNQLICRSSVDCGGRICRIAQLFSTAMTFCDTDTACFNDQSSICEPGTDGPPTPAPVTTNLPTGVLSNTPTVSMTPTGSPSGSPTRITTTPTAAPVVVTTTPTAAPVVITDALSTINPTSSPSTNSPTVLASTIPSASPMDPVTLLPTASPMGDPGRSDEEEVVGGTLEPDIPPSAPGTEAAECVKYDLLPDSVKEHPHSICTSNGDCAQFFFQGSTCRLFPGGFLSCDAQNNFKEFPPLC